jgi:hypothetical protein
MTRAKTTVENFVTVFDALYLPQGIALHMSMDRVIHNYVLWIICVDDETYEVLSNLALSNVRLISLKLVETSELKRIKQTRTKGEYCWTLSPFAPRFVFETDKSIDRVTYIDADLWFLKSPDPIFEEFTASAKHVLITDHSYAAEYDQSLSSGQFCVQFMCFTRVEGEFVRKWWEERCIEWCFNRYEDGKFGDQRYLDSWPQQFPKLVHILQNKELALAPWNAIRFPFGNAVFFHFHGLRISSKKRVNTGGYSLPAPVVRFVYKPYINDLKTAIQILGAAGVTIRIQAKPIGYIIKFIRVVSFLRKKLLYSISSDMRI